MVVANMAAQENSNVLTYIFGAFVLYLVFGGDDKESDSNVTIPTRQSQQSLTLKTEQLTQTKKQEPKLTPKTVIIAPEVNPKSSIKTLSAVTQQPIKKNPIFRVKEMYVDASRLNVRNGAGKSHKVIWTLKRDQKVRVTNKQDDWLFVEGSRFKGWVFGSYLTNKPTQRQVALPKKKAASGLSTSAIKKILIKRSHAYYDGNCPCPYNRTSRGHKCGKRSAYSRPGGASPLCYPSDVSQAMVAQYRARQ